MQMKQVIKDISKVLEIPFDEVNEFTRNIPEKDANGEPIKHVDNLNGIEGAKEFFAKYPDVLKFALKLEGTPRHVSQHPAGIGVTPCEITDLIPVQNAKPTADNIEPGYLAEYEKDNFELSGVVKLDVLKLAAATQLQYMLDIINHEYKDYVDKNFNGKLIDENIPMDDEKAWDLLCKGDTLGVFQMENAKVAVPTLHKVKPRNIEELAAVTSFIRPGAVGLDDYVMTKNDPTKRRRIDPRLDCWLDKTEGAIAFQEQIMQLISTLMGIPFGKADIYRRALEKPKKLPDAFAEFNENLVPAGLANGFSKEVCEKVRKLIIDNSGYAFNASHAVSYSYITYWMSWLKANHPLVWYTCMFNDDVSKLKDYMDEASKAGIKVLPPNVSRSQYLASIEDKNENSIRIGFNAVKGIGEAAVNGIKEVQPFSSINDFFDKTSSCRAVNKKVIEALIRANAFEGLPLVFDNELMPDQESVYMNRSQMMLWYSKVGEFSAKKSIPNYLIPKELIKNKFLNDTELIFDDDYLVIPETYLDEFKLKLENVSEYKTRKRPKGRLKNTESTKMNKIPVICRPFVNDREEIMNIVESKLSVYINEVHEFGYSFLDHPLESKIKDMDVYNDSIDGSMIIEAGMVSEIIQRQTKKGKTFYWVILQTPKESVRVTVWSDQFEKYSKLLQFGSLIMVKGIKGYGGMSLEQIRDANKFAYMTKEGK